MPIELKFNFTTDFFEKPKNDNFFLKNEFQTDLFEFLYHGNINKKYQSHIRSGHWRHYKSGLKIWVKSYITGKIKKTHFKK